MCDLLKIMTIFVTLIFKKIYGSNKFSRLYLGKSSNDNHFCCLCTATEHCSGVKAQLLEDYKVMETKVIEGA